MVCIELRLIISKKKYICFMEFKKIWKYHLLLAIFVIALDFFGDYVYRGKKGLFNNFEYANLVLVFYIVFFTTYFLLLIF